MPRIECGEMVGQAPPPRRTGGAFRTVMGGKVRILLPVPPSPRPPSGPKRGVGRKPSRRHR